VEALAADRADADIPPPDEQRPNNCWSAQLAHDQWVFTHARRGLVPTWNEAGNASLVANRFRIYRSYADFWERAQPVAAPEFVEWVEEQRSKAA